jgi:2-polyprenyl-6-methoxyphenol hydroxylase-like FAD-dependent oxidoreductase
MTPIPSGRSRSLSALRPLIIGGGVAGTVAAMALQKAGFDPILFEAYERSGGLAHGVYLTIAVNGLDALRAIDAHHVVPAAGFPSGRMTFFSGSGKRLGSMAMGPTLPDGTVTHTLRRSDLYEGLYREAASRGMLIVHGKRLVDADLLPGGGVRARFDDGTTADGDLLIGADGVHSTTRRLIDPANPQPRYTGLGNTGGFTRTSGIDAKPGDYLMVWGRRCFFGYTIAPDGEIWWFANPPSRDESTGDDLRAMTTARLKTHLLDLLKVDRTPGAQIVASTTREFRLTNQYEVPTVRTWHNDTMVVIGDAAHAVSPSSGQGASLAAEDAVILAQCLRDASSLRLALQAYEQRRRARVERIVHWASGMNATKKQGLVARVLRDLILPFVLRKADDPREMTKLSWMFHHHIEWDASALPHGESEDRSKDRLLVAS